MWTNSEYAALAAQIDAMSAEQIVPLAKDGITYVCPQCGSGTGPKGTGMKHYTDGQPHFHCYACGCHGDHVTIAAMHLGIQETGIKQLLAVAELFGLVDARNAGAMTAASPTPRGTARSAAMRWKSPAYALLAAKVDNLPPEQIAPRAGKKPRMYVCPQCGEEMKLFMDGQPHFHCFSCRFHGDYVKTAAMRLGIKETGGKQLLAVASHFGLVGATKKQKADTLGGVPALTAAV